MTVDQLNELDIVNRARVNESKRGLELALVKCQPVRQAEAYGQRKDHEAPEACGVVPGGSERSDHLNRANEKVAR